jgi:hypothetical protein
MDITNLDYLGSAEAANSACKPFSLRLQGGEGISRYSFFRGSRSSGYQPVNETPMTIDNFIGEYCQDSSDGGSCSIEDYYVSTQSSGEGGSPRFRSVLGLGRLNNGVFSFSSASSTRSLGE